MGIGRSTKITSSIGRSKARHGCALSTGSDKCKVYYPTTTTTAAPTTTTTAAPTTTTTV